MSNRPLPQRTPFATGPRSPHAGPPIDVLVAVLSALGAWADSERPGGGVGTPPFPVTPTAPSSRRQSPGDQVRGTGTGTDR